MNKIDLEHAFKTEFISSHDNWKALCPFHDERTASFYVHKEDLIAHCFGCGIGGRIDILYSKFASIPVAEARATLGITLQETVEKRTTNRRRLDEQVSYFPESWLGPFKKEVHRYVIDRGFSIQTIQHAGGVYDKSLKRQVFPHRDREGRLLGAVGRACTGQEPKWYFYWDYRKGAALYDPFRRSRESRSTIGQMELVVVEGIFDLLWLYQNGIRNAVAILGSKGTSSQIREIKSISTSVTIGLDNDEAGREGSEILYRSLKRNGEVKHIEWPSFANDWMDLSKEQIHEVIGSSQTTLQRKVRRNVHRNSISNAEGSSSEAVQSQEIASSVGTGYREDDHIDSSGREAARIRES